jgi:pyrroloquinoline quinone biosynthesis protein D
VGLCGTQTIHPLPTLIEPRSVPRFGPGMKFRHDATRGAWIILGPERLFLPDDHAVAVLKLVDGSRNVADIVHTLATTYQADAAIIEADVLSMLNDLSASGAVRW